MWLLNISPILWVVFIFFLVSFEVQTFSVIFNVMKVYAHIFF